MTIAIILAAILICGVIYLNYITKDIKDDNDTDMWW